MNLTQLTTSSEVQALTSAVIASDDRIASSAAGSVIPQIPATSDPVIDSVSPTATQDNTANIAAQQLGNDAQPSSTDREDMGQTGIPASTSADIPLSRSTSSSIPGTTPLSDVESIPTSASLLPSAPSPLSTADGTDLSTESSSTINQTTFDPPVSIVSITKSTKTKAISSTSETTSSPSASTSATNPDMFPGLSATASSFSEDPATSSVSTNRPKPNKSSSLAVPPTSAVTSPAPYSINPGASNLTTKILTSTSLPVGQSSSSVSRVNELDPNFDIDGKNSALSSVTNNPDKTWSFSFPDSSTSSLQSTSAATDINANGGAFKHVLTSSSVIPLTHSISAGAEPSSSSGIVIVTNTITPSRSLTDATTSSPLADATGDTTVTAADQTSIFVTAGTTLHGSAAVAAAIAAASETGSPAGDSGITTPASGGKKFGTLVILGIVGAVVVGLILLYLIWHCFCRKKNRGEADDGDNAEKQYDEDGYPTHNNKPRKASAHSGFDFIDEPISHRRSTRRSRKQSRDPFEDNQIDTWYEDPHAHQDYGRRQTGYDYQREEILTDSPWPMSEMKRDSLGPFDDSLAETYAENLQTGEGQVEQDHGPHVPNVDPETYGGPSLGPDTLPFEPENPFELAPSASSIIESSEGRLSGRSLTPPKRPETRPETQLTFSQFNEPDQVPDEIETQEHAPNRRTSFIDTPATSSLLPWLGTRSNSPLPPVPAMEYMPAVPLPQKTSKAKSRDGRSQGVARQQAVSEKGLARKEKDEERRDIVPMAQTPWQGGNQGFQGVIPNFR